MNVIPSDSPSVFDALNTLVLNDAKLAIVRANNPPAGVAGFIFDAVDEDMFELESSIPDFYVAGNTAAQDMISLHPERFTVTSKVAEVVFSSQNVKRGAVLPNSLPLAPGLSPQLTPGALQTQLDRAQNLARTQDSVAANDTLYGYYLSKLPQQPNATKQTKIFGYFYQLWLARSWFSVETPWGIMTNMAIESLRARQGPTSKLVSDFTITFKKLRFVDSPQIQAGTLAGRAAYQQASVTQNGTIGELDATTAQVQQFNQQTQSP